MLLIDSQIRRKVPIRAFKKGNNRSHPDPVPIQKKKQKQWQKAEIKFLSPFL